ncbi:hypothetical protein PLICRDRAFT_35041 [Plicaturopsis crispa FD-325 SS-3]|nr:hypothetical protein PLICRDRAFT_35041 [Plicaturopsis crispa FD-325 SS-3]
MDSDFDAIILGTGVAESIAAAALSKAGFKIAHIDTNAYYGADDASLSVDELVQWADAQSPSSRFTSISHSPTIPQQSRQYALSLSPSIIPSVGPFISCLVSSGVARYGGFRLLERVAVYDRAGDTLKTVPSSKEDVFKNKDITLLDKRRIMRFLMFAVSEFEGRQELEGKEYLPFPEFLKSVFSLNNEMVETIAYALAYCITASDQTLPALQRIRSYLRSSGRYGTSPFLVGHYGGAGEIAQGFCRTAAVNGAVYILGRRILSVVESSGEAHGVDPPYTVELEDVPDKLTCDLLISSSQNMVFPLQHPPKYISSVSDGVPQYVAIARCIAIVDKPVIFPRANEGTDGGDVESEVAPTIDTSVLVFPPASVESASSTVSVTALVTGEGSLSAPKGKYIIYLSMPLQQRPEASPEVLLRPYLNAILLMTTSPSSEDPSSPHSPEPLFHIFYLENNPPSHVSPSTPEAPSPTALVTPPSSFSLPEFSDDAARNAESVFWEAVSVLKASSRVEQRRRAAVEGDDASWKEVDGFWPALEPDADEEVEEGW